MRRESTGKVVTLRYFKKPIHRLTQAFVERLSKRSMIEALIKRTDELATVDRNGSRSAMQEMNGFYNTISLTTATPLNITTHPYLLYKRQLLLI